MMATVSIEYDAISGVNLAARVRSYAVGSVRVANADTDAETPVDPTSWTVVVWGTLA
jgi:hypothetical protein